MPNFSIDIQLKKKKLLSVLVKMSVLPGYVNKLVAKIAVEAGFSEYSIETKPGSNQNDGFAASLTCVIISGQRQQFDGSGATDELHLMCKLLPENSTRRKDLLVDELFEREALMYNKILPMFAAFQKEKGLKESECFVSYPKCYAAIADPINNEFVIIMDDLRRKGFVMWDIREAPPVQHLELVMAELAKFHAISFALKDQRPDAYNELKSHTDIMHRIFNGCVKQMTIEGFERSIATLENSALVPKLIELKENHAKIQREYLLENSCEAFGVLGHGDCWTNNNMFRYENGVYYQQPLKP